ncbi:MAG TPA: ABC transporter permease [Planctomycetota bacterium]
MNSTTESPAAPSVQAPATRSASALTTFETLQRLSIAILTLVLLIVALSHARSVPLWMSNLLTYAAGVGIVACGMTMVMIGGGFDLSVGSTAAVCGVVCVMTLQLLAAQGIGVALPLAILATLLVGILLGAINGALIAYVGVNPFVVTMSTALIFRGIGLVLTSGGQSQQVPNDFKPAFGSLYWGVAAEIGGLKISMPVIIFAGVFLLSIYVLRFTRFGHYVYAVGGNEKASWLAGINTRFVTAGTYVISGLVCAVAALVWTALSTTAQASDHYGKEMIVIASVVVGGTPLSGGRGGLLSTLCGLLLLCTIEQLLTQFGIDPQYRQIVTGLIIVTVVAIDSYFKRRLN